MARARGALGVILIHTTESAGLCCFGNDYVRTYCLAIGYGWDVVQSSYAVGEQLSIATPIFGALAYKVCCSHL